MRFEWDESKNKENKRKHGVSFKEAAKVLQGEYFEAFDESHSDDEDRWWAIGPSSDGILFVVFVEPLDDVFRIISARPALQHEVDMYRNWRGL